MADAATRKRKSRAKMSEEERRAARAADAERKRKKRQEDSLEKKEGVRKQDRTQHQASRRAASEEIKEGVRKQNRTQHQASRRAEGGYSRYRTEIEKSTRLRQADPPDGEELIFHERDAINSLLMYHHRSGVEHTLPALRYIGVFAYKTTNELPFNTKK